MATRSFKLVDVSFSEIQEMLSLTSPSVAPFEKPHECFSSTAPVRQLCAAVGAKRPIGSGPNALFTPS